MKENQPNLFQDIKNELSLLEKLKNYDYAQALYAAICNVDWYKPPLRYPFSCSWRYAGHEIADIRNEILPETAPHEDYCDFYCSGISDLTVPEGTITPEIRADLLALGYYPKEILLDD